MKVELKISYSNRLTTVYDIVGDNGKWNSHVLKDGFGVWFVAEGNWVNFSAEELEAVAQAMKELK